jgi:hypothetical protein
MLECRKQQRDFDKPVSSFATTVKQETACCLTITPCLNVAMKQVVNLRGKYKCATEEANERWQEHHTVPQDDQKEAAQFDTLCETRVEVAVGPRFEGVRASDTPFVPL